MSFVGDFIGDFFSGSGGPDFPLVSGGSVSTPGFDLSATTSGGRVKTTLTPKGTVPQKQFGIRFPRILTDIDKLRGTIKPGFSQVRQSRLAAVDAARDRAIGNLRDNLARRKIRGSSFAFDALSGAEAEFGQARADEEAKVFFEELQSNQQLIAFESGILADALNRELKELGMAANFGVAFGQIISSNAQFAQQLAADEMSALGSGIGNLLNLGIDAFKQGGPFGDPLPGSQGSSEAARLAFMFAGV